MDIRPSSDTRIMSFGLGHSSVTVAQAAATYFGKFLNGMSRGAGAVSTQVDVLQCTACSKLSVRLTSQQRHEPCTSSSDRR